MDKPNILEPLPKITKKRVKRPSWGDYCLQEAIDAVSLVATMNNEGIITYCNDRFVDFTGYSKRHLLGKKFIALTSFHREVTLWHKMWVRVNSGKVWKGEVLFHKKNDAQVVANVMILPMKNATPDHHDYLVIAQEIHEEKNFTSKIKSKSNTIYKNQSSPYTSIFKNISDPIVVLDADMIVSYCNKSALSFLGIQEDQFGKEVISTFIPQAINKKLFDTINQASKNKTSLYVNEIHIPQTTKVHEVNVEVLQDEIVLHFKPLDVQQDIQLELERLRMVSSNTNTLLILSDLEGKVVWVNEAFTKMTGYSTQEVIGKIEVDFLKGQDTNAAVLKQLITARERGNVLRTEVLFYKKNGKPYWVDVEFKPYADATGNRIGFMSIEKDISEMKSAVEEMQRSEKILQAFMDNAPLHAFIKDLQGRYVFCNRNFEKFKRSKVNKSKFKGFPITDGMLYSKRQLEIRKHEDKKVVEQGLTSQIQLKMHDRTFLEYKFPLFDKYENVSSIGGIAIDVTDKLEAQKEIQSTSDRLHSIIDNLSNGIVYQYIVNKHGRVESFEYVSSGVTDLLGISAESIIQDPLVFFRIIDKKDLNEIRKRSEIARAQMKSFDFEYRINTANGNLKWIHTRATPKSLPNGKTLWNGLAVNITSKKNLELIVRANEAKLQGIFNSMICGLLVTDANGVITYANKSSEQILGISQRDIQHGLISVNDFYCIDENGKQLDRDKIPILITLTEKKICSEVELGLISGDKKIKWLSAGTTPLFDNDQNIIGAVANFLDITEQRNAQRKVASMHSKLKGILNAAIDITFFVDLDLRIIHYNKAAETIGDRVLHKPIEANVHIMELVPESVQDEFRHFFQSAVNGSSTSVVREHVGKDGIARWFYMRFLCVYDDQGFIMGVSFTCTDITDQKNTEYALFQSKKYFESIVNSQSNFLIRMDLDGSVTFVNDQFLKKLGLEKRNILSRDYLHLILKEDHHECILTIQSCFDIPGTVIPVTFRIISGDDHICWTKWEFVAIQDEFGNFIGIQGVGVDVTQRVLYQQELQAVNARLKLATSAAQMGVWEFNPSTNEVYYDDIVADIFDIRDRRKASWEDFMSKLPRKDYEMTRHAISKLTPTANILDIKYRVFKDADFQYIKTFATGEFDDKGKLLKIVGVDYDITKQEIANQKLRESEQRFKDMADASPVLIWMADDRQQFRYFNKTWLDFTGRSLNDEVGQGWFDNIHPDDLLAYKNVLKDSYKSESSFSIEFRMRAADGKYRWIADHGKPRYLKDGGFIGYIGSCFDIHSRKEAEQKLIESENRFHTFMHYTPVNNWITDREGNVFFGNESYFNLFNIQPDQRKNVSVFDLYDDEAAQHLMQDIQKISSTGNVITTIDTWNKPDDTQGEYLVHKFPMGDLIGGVAVDITEQRKAEKEIIKSLKEKDVLIKEIHHRVKNNLQLISSILYIRMNGMPKSEIRDFLEGTRQKIRSIALIHERLLQSGSVSEVDVSDYLGRLVLDIQMSSSRQDFRIEFLTSFDSVILQLDKAIYCGLIINEVISNSLKHAFPNAETGSISVSFKSLTDGYELTIGDNGKTLPEHIHPGETGSFGMQLLDIFIRQVNGSYSIDRTNGTMFKIKFSDK
jgi:PAS domain S-box-containing protein